MRKNTRYIIMAIICLTAFAVNSFAVTLLTEEAALKEMFPDCDEVVTTTHEMTADEIAKVKERMGGNLVHFQDGSKSGNVAEQTKYNFYIGMKGGEKIRMAVMEAQPGKWGPVQFVVAIDVKTEKVNNLAVMMYVEKRGRPIARKNYLKQFIGKGSSDAISVRSKKGVRRDIRAVSGATISSDCTCFAVRKVVALFDEVYKKNLVAALAK